MARRKANVADLPDDLALLDDLIGKCYSELVKSITKTAKLGDFIKMIELRRKLAPAESDQKKFWNMLARIHRETASKSEKGTAKKSRKSKVKS
ncbi:MAG: hypothetical protein KAT79_05190 [candidate division Zixibacteria bacterium]|nr:hypothetical protein [candidate division Zixibacteria bacterium]